MLDQGAAHTITAKPPKIYAAVLFALGLALADSGLWLVMLGGSFYYAAASAALIVCAVLL